MPCSSLSSTNFTGLVEQPLLQIILHLLEQSFQITLTGTEVPEKTLFVSEKVILSGEIEEKKRAYRIKLQRSLYQMLSEWTKKTLPWGTLTGVRPVKLVLDKLEQGIKEELDKMLKPVVEYPVHNLLLVRST